ncbi:MAG: NIPSNAP family protein [Notoacmeibacter sp.]|nr:NIPSNAP family protein [Notoacmeibacter sp.]
MIFEQRVYQLGAGQAGEFLKVYEAEGLHIITKYARLVGCWTTESGTLNSVVFIWSYDDFGHRSAQRAKLGADAEWQAFVPKILPFLVHQESTFLTPTAFSPLA